MNPCLLPADFAAMDLERKAAAIHTCHERLLEDFALCRAKHGELAAWVRGRFKAK